MLANFDFERASAHANRVASEKMSGKGPFVIIVNADGQRAGLFDFSQLAAVDFRRQFSAVVDYLSQDVDLWENDYYGATFREKLRRYILEDTGDAPIVVASFINLKPVS